MEPFGRIAAFFVYPTVKTWLVASLAVTGTFSTIDFTRTVNLGGIIVGLLVLGFGALFTIRANVAKVWKDNYEAEQERARRLEQERDEQRQLKHDALSEVAALRLTDQKAVLSQMGRDHRELITMLVEQQRVGLEKAAQMLSATEGRLLEQMSVVTRAQADLALIIDRSTERLERLEREPGDRRHPA